MEWTNEPRSWSDVAGRLTLTTDPRTDFWRRTNDGAVRHSGHFYYQRVSGDFRLSVKVTGRYANLYDQAGLMILADEQIWMKCGIEYIDGVQQASAVVTREWSDWSVLPLGNPSTIWLRLMRRAGTVEGYYSLEGEEYSMIRQAYLSEQAVLRAGAMAAAPTGPGFEVAFEDFRLEGEAVGP